MSGQPEWAKWLRANKHDLAPLTGTDRKALAAIAECWQLYAYTGTECVLRAISELLKVMQPKTRHLARELIAYAMDWGDRDRLWPGLCSDPDSEIGGRS